MSRRYQSPCGWLIARLINRRESAGAVLARVFERSPLRAPLTRAIRHGSLVTGELAGPVYESDGRTYRPPSRKPEDDITRDLGSLAAARMLACFLLYAERIDPRTRKACGSAVWQGTVARRLRLKATRGKPRKDGTAAAPGGTREVQRYTQLLEAAGAIATLQPNAANVPDPLRARPNACGDQWAYNLITICAALPLEIQNAIRRWRGEPPIRVPPSSSARATNAEVLPAAELATLAAALALCSGPNRAH